MNVTSKSEKAPLLTDKTPKVDYIKRYDQVSWRSADTDFETDPMISGIGVATIKKMKCLSICTRRNRKLIALIIVVIIFLIIMGAVIYLYYSKPVLLSSTSTSPVQTDCGNVTGIIMPTTNDHEIYVFRGIPYALPPVRLLRWSAPIALSENKSNCWKGVLKAQRSGSICAQGKKNGSEDCLYLDVFTPKLSAVGNLPVFVWLHGGYLMSGSGSTIGYSPNMEFVTSMNSVVVTINYRLNAFGFLTLKELWHKDKGFGNYGLMDQILALKWVQRNIKNFGGDPSSVTLCGHNAGGSSIFALLASPKADGLFHKVISMSGFPKIEKSYINASEENRIFINRTQCGHVSVVNIKDCLYNLTTHEILDAIPYFKYPYWGFIKENLLDFPLKGSIDGGLIVIDPLIVTRPPKELHFLSSHIKNKISILVGSTAQEIGVSPRIVFDGNDQWSNYKNYLNNLLNKFSPNFSNIVLGKLYSNKTINENISSEYSTEYLHETITSDVRTNCPINLLSKAFARSDKHRVYRYIVTHRPNTPINIFKYPAKFAFHMWDKIALFNFEMVDYNPSNSDLRFQTSLRENFKHFMLFGHMKNSDWDKGKTGVFAENGSVVVLPADYHERQCLFWNNPSNGFLPYSWSD